MAGDRDAAETFRPATSFGRGCSAMDSHAENAEDNEFNGNSYNPAALEREVARLMADDDVQRKSGIYEYLLSGGAREKALSIRAFTESQKRAAYERQTAIAKKRGVSNCPICANGTGGADAMRT